VLEDKHDVLLHYGKQGLAAGYCPCGSKSENGDLKAGQWPDCILVGVSILSRM
jgi:hypothetical protein